MTAHAYAERKSSCRTPLGRLLGLIDKTESCWLWKGYRTPQGYGQFNYFGNAQWAHRIAYQLLVGPIPEGLQLDHLCRNRACVNPDHLEPVTNRENQRRGIRATKTHCPHGHPYSGHNLIVATVRIRGRRYQGRRCRTCQYAAAENRRLRKLALRREQAA